MLNTPVLLLIFNRTDTTARVFEAVRQAKPKQLFIAADGPRPGREDDLITCEATRKVVMQVDWDCEVKTLFRGENLGCGVAVYQGINWFFEQVEQGIILEDDCLPHPSFFGFCEALLHYYKNEPRVMQISGDNFQHGQRRGEASYYFSKYFHICGWATWRNRWQHYDFQISRAGEYRQNQLIEQRCRHLREREFWHRKLDMLSGGKRRDIWDYQWMFAGWGQQGVSAVANVNLIQNIGFDSGATHTVAFDPRVANLPTEDIGPIIYTKTIEEDKQADHYTFFKSGAFFQPTLKARIRWQIKALVPDFIKSWVRNRSPRSQPIA